MGPGTVGCMDTHTTLTEDINTILDGWADDTHLIRVHDDARRVELAVRVMNRCCPTYPDPGVAWDWVDVGPAGWLLRGSWSAECRGCGAMSRNWVHDGITIGSDLTDDEISEQVISLRDAVETTAATKAAAEADETLAGLRRDMDAEIEALQACDDPEDWDDEVDRLPSVDDMSEPGVGVDHDGTGLVAWTYDPAGGDMIEVTAPLPARP